MFMLLGGYYAFNGLDFSAFDDEIAHLILEIAEIFFFLFVGIILAVVFGWLGWLYSLFGVMLVYFALHQHRHPHLLHWLKWQQMPSEAKNALAGSREQIRKAMIK